MDYGQLCSDIALLAKGMSGREIAKLGVAWQASGYASEDGILTQSMIMEKVTDSIRSHQKKVQWLSEDEVRENRQSVYKTSKASAPVAAPTAESVLAAAAVSAAVTVAESALASAAESAPVAEIVAESASVAESAPVAETAPAAESAPAPFETELIDTAPVISEEKEAIDTAPVITDVKKVIDTAPEVIDVHDRYQISVQLHQRAAAVIQAAWRSHRFRLAFKEAYKPAQYVTDKHCNICDMDFESTAKTIDHIIKDHLDVASGKEDGLARCVF